MSILHGTYLAMTVESRGLPRSVLTHLRAQAIPLFNLVTEREALMVGVTPPSVVAKLRRE